MLNNYDCGKIAILIDFDGTITTKDTNDKLISFYGNEETAILEELYNKGDINYINFFELIIKEIKITEQEYIDFITNEFEISKGFINFYKNININNIPLAIISGGFINGIIPFFNKYGIVDIDIFSNSLIFDKDNIKIKFYDHDNYTCCTFGPCGNCKIRHYNKYKEIYENVIFIGDGRTDEYIAEVADMVFAKDLLLEFCIANRIEHIPWNDFNEINNLIFGRD